MRFLAKKLILNVAIGITCLGLPVAALFAAALADRRPLIFESLESKTPRLAPIFNRVTFVTENGRDIWLMQQSHDGPPATVEKWDLVDRIAISVGKGDDGKSTADFLQLEPGHISPLPSDFDLSKAVGFKVPCGICHNNGPRAIRPNSLSANTPLRSWDQWRVFVWNLRIKGYGRTTVAPSRSEHVGVIPYRFTSPAATVPLQVGGCTYCHKDDGPFARGVLTKQNMIAIRFLVEQGFMPPLGIPLPDKDRRDLDDFLRP